MIEILIPSILVSLVIDLNIGRLVHPDFLLYFKVIILKKIFIEMIADFMAIRISRVTVEYPPVWCKGIL
jgi:hypothetical protein